MRRLLAIALLLLFALPFPVRAATLTFSRILGMDGTDPSLQLTENLPACCRKAGKHYCAMHQAEHGLAAAADQTDPAPTLSTFTEKCPYCPRAIVPSPTLSFVPAGSNPGMAEILPTHRSTPAQVESLYRIASARSRQKRGPPSA